MSRFVFFTRMGRQAALVALVGLTAGCNLGRVPETPAPAPTTTPTSTLQPSATPAPTATPVRTPPALPSPFSTDLLNPRDTPHTYQTDTCQYLHDRWDPANSPPGTVVMVIMFHSVTEGPISNPNQISLAAFKGLMEGLKAAGFEAVRTTQLADFLERNVRIPPRSVLLVADDRHYGAYFENLFRPYWERFGWPVVNSWISAAGTAPDLWADNSDLEMQGWVDHQAHGVVHNIPIWPGSTDEYILGELQGSVDAFEEHFGKRPIAFIWPGGGFSPRAAELARRTGYRLGFTINPRGPVMFNWVPLGDQEDPMRPSYQPEAGVNDPLMVLPRYWDTDAVLYLQDIVAIGEQAAAQAEQQRSTELDFYEIMCASTYGVLPPP
jgi:peptidoglycan/xylan/chitin deacetylase (PgdA/CDA1 family)